MRPLPTFFVFLTALAITPVVTLSQESREVTKSFPLNTGGEVTLDTYKGTITVTGWDKPTVEIRARIESDDTFGDEYAAEKVRDTEVLFEATDQTVRIKTDYDHMRSHRRGFWSMFDDNGSLPLVHYTIVMPAKANLRIKDYKSRSSISGLQSDVDLNTYKGEVDVKGIEGSLRLETYKGEAKADFLKMARSSRIETYKGTVDIQLPKRLGFDMDVDLGYRTDFDSDVKFQSSASSRRHRDIEFEKSVNGGGPPLIVRSTKGSVRLRQR